MPWQTLTDADVLAEFNESEKSLYDAAKSTDDLGRIIGNVVKELRGAIAGRGVAMDTDGTIPSGFITPAAARCRWNFLNAIPTGTSLLNDARKAANQEYVDLLKSIRTDKTFYIESVDGTSPVPSPSITSPRRNFSRCNQDGI